MAAINRAAENNRACFFGSQADDLKTIIPICNKGILTIRGKLYAEGIVTRIIMPGRLRICDVRDVDDLKTGLVSGNKGILVI